MSCLVKSATVSLRCSQAVTACCRLQLYSSEASGRTSWFDFRKKQKARYPNGWHPQKKLTRYQMDYLRTLKREQPQEWTITKLATKFGVSPAAVTRILKSKFDPPPAIQERQDRKAQEMRDKRRQMAMDGGVKGQGVHSEYKKPNEKDLIIDFDT